MSAADLAELDRRKDELVTNLLTLNSQVEKQLAATAETSGLVNRLMLLAERVRQSEDTLLDGRPPPAGLIEYEAAYAHGRLVDRWTDEAYNAITVMLAASWRRRATRMSSTFRAIGLRPNSPSCSSSTRAPSTKPSSSRRRSSSAVCSSSR